MATSGSQNFSESRDQLVTDAFELLGLYGLGRTPSASDMALGNNMLNKMIKTWSTQGLHLWAKEEGVLYLTQYVSQYSLGNSSSDAKCTLKSDEIVTSLSGNHSTSATNLTVDSTTGMTVGDYIGIVLTDKSSHWTTIATIPSSTTLTINSGLPSAASDNGNVYTFTSKLYKPLRIHSARLVTGIDSGSTSTIAEILMTPTSYDDYYNLPTKTHNGSTPTLFHYDPKLTNGNLFIWPRPDDTRARIEFSYERILDDLDSAGDDFDFPAEWLEPITWQLAARVGIPFGKGEKVRNDILPAAADLIEALKNWDTEITSVSMIPDMENR